MIDQLPFLVYGTLRPGQGNYAGLLHGRTCAEVRASVPSAAMFSGGAFPYAIATEDPQDVIVGDLLDIPSALYTEVLADLDRLEGYREDRESNHYERRRVTVTTAQGNREAWIYLAGARTAERIRNLPRITSGDWFTRTSDSSLAHR